MLLVYFHTPKVLTGACCIGAIPEVFAAIASITLPNKSSIPMAMSSIR